MTNGWSGSREINTVTYETEQVSHGELENWLKRSGTYRDTLPKQNKGSSDK